jgi:hypothetical protein
MSTPDRQPDGSAAASRCRGTSPVQAREGERRWQTSDVNGIEREEWKAHAGDLSHLA